MPSHYRGDPDTFCALDAFIKLTRAAESLNARIQQRQTTDGLTTSQFAVLEALYHLGPLSQGQVSARVLKSTGNITLVIDNLEKRGLVWRERNNADRRLVIINLTDTGRERIERILPGHVQAVYEELSVLTVEEQALLGNLCKKLGLGSSKR